MKCIRYEPHLEKCKSKIKILSTRNIFCRKFAAVRRKNATFCPSYFNSRSHC